MKYQLVIQFSEEVYGDIDWISGIEDKLEKYLPNAEIDGHDIGSGEINIFIHTNDPLPTFETVIKVLRTELLHEEVKIAYRNFKSHNYVCLWPKDLTAFNVI